MAKSTLRLKGHARYLGTPISYSDHPTALWKELWEQKWSKAIYRMAAIQRLPVPQGTKVRLVEAAAQSLLKYALHCYPEQIPSLGRMGTQVRQALGMKGLPIEATHDIDELTHSSVGAGIRRRGLARQQGERQQPHDGGPVATSARVGRHGPSVQQHLRDSKRHPADGGLSRASFWARRVRLPHDAW